MKHEQTIQSLAELVAEQWETIQQKRNYIEYLENELRGWGSLELTDVIKKTNDLKNMISAYNSDKTLDDEMVIAVTLDYLDDDYPGEIQLSNFESADITREFNENYDEACSHFDGVKVFTLKEKKANS